MSPISFPLPLLLLIVPVTGLLAPASRLGGLFGLGLCRSLFVPGRFTFSFPLGLALGAEFRPQPTTVSSRMLCCSNRRRIGSAARELDGSHLTPVVDVVALVPVFWIVEK